MSVLPNRTASSRAVEKFESCGAGRKRNALTRQRSIRQRKRHWVRIAKGPGVVIWGVPVTSITVITSDLLQWFMMKSESCGTGSNECKCTRRWSVGRSTVVTSDLLQWFMMKRKYCSMGRSRRLCTSDMIGRSVVVSNDLMRLFMTKSEFCETRRNECACTRW